MEEKKIWEKFFDAHAPIYNDNIFTKNTLKEVDFLEDVLSLKPKDKILDIGCGTGRHSTELAKRGYNLTGIDISAGMLEIAQQSALEAGVNIRFVKSDARSFSLDDTFDAAICLCEGSFGLLGSADDSIESALSILKNVASSLKPGGTLIMTALNALNMIRKYNFSDYEAGHFDFINLVESSSYPPQEGMEPLPLREKGFVPTELELLCRLSGLNVINIWGGTAGNWGKRHPDPDEMELMLHAKRSLD
jgi:SAM-dependent methyltransferase